jgi:hypothetical protein
LTFSDPKAWDQADGKYGMGITFVNAGQHAAYNLSGRL